MKKTQTFWYGIMLGSIILLSYSRFSLAAEDLDATFVSKPVTSKLVNGQVLGSIIFDRVRRDTHAGIYLRGYYVHIGTSVVNNPAGYTLCKSNVDGIGLQYINWNGSFAKTCGNTSLYAFEWTPGPKGSYYQINKEMFRIVVYDAAKLTAGGTFTLSSIVKYWVDGTYTMMGAVNITPSVTVTIPPQKTAAIYFPTYPAGNPNINLPFKISGNGYQHLTATAEKKLQMCLTDGNSIHSSQFQLVFKDLSSFPGTGQNFHLNRQGGRLTIGNQVTYHISIFNPVAKSNQSVSMNRTITWNIVNPNNVDTINYVINGKNQPCVLTPLTITVPQFNYSSKNSGNYQGNISITFTPTLNN